jgi:TetR/AcrR family transcriptional regulator, transcriptional repressor for nem operon
MRMSREAMAEHHQAIVEVAARMLRERGIKGTSVADLMQAAGLTHGGFYRHFESKDALVAEAVQSIHDALVKCLETKADKASEADAVNDYVAKYLSQGHVANPGVGCPMAAFGVEAARETAEIRRVFANGTQRTIDKLSAGLRGTPSERRTKAIQMFISLVGAVVIARAVGDSELREEVLGASREALGVSVGRKR